MTSASVLATTMALRERWSCYPLSTTCSETVLLPTLKLIATDLGDDSEEEVVVAAEEAPGWLPAGVHLPAPCQDYYLVSVPCTGWQQELRYI